MQEPQITYRGMQHSPAMDERIRELAAKLEDIQPLEDEIEIQRGEVRRHREQRGEPTP